MDGLSDKLFTHKYIYTINFLYVIYFSDKVNDLVPNMTCTVGCVIYVLYVNSWDADLRIFPTS